MSLNGARVFDASALLAFLFDEPGAKAVRDQLALGDGHCSAANWSEIAQKVLVRGGPWPQSRALLFGFGLEVEPVTTSDAEAAARLWRKSAGLSLADRLCLATGARLSATVVTCDQAWDGLDGVLVVVR